MVQWWDADHVHYLRDLLRARDRNPRGWGLYFQTDVVEVQCVYGIRELDEAARSKMACSQHAG